MLDMQGRGGLRIEEHFLRVMGGNFDRLLKGNILDDALENSLLWLIGNVIKGGCTVISLESIRGSGRSVVTRGSSTSTGPVAERNTFCQIPVSRSRMAGIQSQPMVERKVGPSRAVMPPFRPMPARIVCSCGSPGCG